MAKYFSIGVLLLCLAVTCYCWPSGAPLGACSTMHPEHANFPAQTDAAPFQVVAKASVSGQTVEVTIMSTKPGRIFKGFMINAIDKDGQVVGAFQEPSPNSDYKTLSCQNGQSQNTATHTSATAKEQITLLWYTPSPSPGSVVFRATVVEEMIKFYIGIQSNILNL